MGGWFKIEGGTKMLMVLKGHHAQLVPQYQKGGWSPKNVLPVSTISREEEAEDEDEVAGEEEVEKEDGAEMAEEVEDVEEEVESAARRLAAGASLCVLCIDRYKRTELSNW